MTNESQLPMMKSMLNSAMKSGIPMGLFHCYILSTNKEAAAYTSSAFKAITTRKLEVIQLNMNLDSQVLWVDNDIVFFQNCLGDILSKHGDFVMQDDLWGYCTGFFLVRSGVWSRQLITRSLNLIKASESWENDQHAFNKGCNTVPLNKITKLSQDEYPNGYVYFRQNRTQTARILHCNYLSTTSEKVELLKERGFWDESDRAFMFVNKYYI